MFPAFDTLVAAAGVDEMLAAREKEINRGEREDNSVPFSACRLNSPKAAPEAEAGSWRIAFGDGGSDLRQANVCDSNDGENLHGEREEGKEGECAGQVIYGRGNRRKLLGSCTVSQLAIERRRVRDLEVRGRPMGLEGAVGGNSKKRGGELDVDYISDEPAGVFSVKRQAVQSSAGSKHSRDLGSRDSAGRDDEDWRPQLTPKSNAKVKQSFDADHLSTDEKPSSHRRRGRPPGSGNRRPMEPQRVGPDGTKKFNLRSAKFTGVYRTPAGRWRAQFCHRGQVVQLGMYDDEDSAARRWDMEAIRLRGNNTQLNFPTLKPLYVEQIKEADKHNLGYDIEVSEELLKAISDLGDQPDIANVEVNIPSEDPLDNPLAGKQDYGTRRDPRRKQELPEKSSAPAFPHDVNLPDSSGTLDALDNHGIDQWVSAVSPGPSPLLNGTKALPEPILNQVKILLEGVVKSADKDITMANSRMAYASQIMQYGESLKREAQTCVGLYDSRREAAVTLLEKFQTAIAAAPEGGELDKET